MGHLYSILQLGLHRNPRNFSDVSSIKSQIEYTPVQRWKISQKSQNDLNNLLRQTSVDQWTPQVNYFLKLIRNRQAYQYAVQIIIAHIVSQEFKPSLQQLPQKQRNYTQYFNRLANSYFIGNDQQFNQRIIDHVCSKLTPNQKLMNLYQKTKVKYSPNFIQKAILLNYPEIVQKMDEFAQDLIEKEVYIQDQLHLLNFVLSSKGLHQAKQYLHGHQSKFLEKEQLQRKMELQKNLESGKDIYFKMIAKFMEFDNANGAQIVFRGLLQGQHQLSEEDLQYFFYIKCYAAYTYSLGKIQCSFSQFSNLKVEDIVHTFISEHNVEHLHILKRCFQVLQNRNKKQALQLENKFQKAILEYAFSNKCLINFAITILQSKQLQLPKHKLDQIGQSFIGKINECGFQISRNRSKIELIAKQKMNLKGKILRNLRISLDIAQVLLLFNISNKMNVIGSFLTENLRPVEAQEQGLILLKNFISKFYISDRNKKIRLQHLNQEGQIAQIINLNLNKQDSIIRICLYLKQSLFKQTISNSQIYQIIFQHMLYFYRFQEVKTLLDQSEENHQNYIDKYGFVYEMIETIILQNIIETLKKDKIQKSNTDLLIQLDLLKNDNQQKRAANALYKLLKYLQEQQIYLTVQQKETGLNILLLYWLVDNHKERIEVFDYSMIYQKICILNGSSAKQCEDCLLHNQYLHFQVSLAKNAYQLGKNTYGEDIIKQLARYQPPWFAQQLVKIAKSIRNIPQKFLMMAFEHCMKGQDMEFLIDLWQNKQFDKGEGRKRDKLKQFSLNKINSYLQTTGHYTILNDQLIPDQALYRNHVAQMKFTQEKFKNQQDYELFFALFGAQTQRAFYHAIKNKLAIDRIDFFLTQGMKNRANQVFQPFYLVPFYFKFLYFSVRNQAVKKELTYKEYKNSSLKILLDTYPQFKKLLSQDQSNSYLGKMLHKLYQGAFCCQALGKVFLASYVTQEKYYSFIFQQNYRKTLIVDLNEQPMGKSDIIAIRSVCDLMKIGIIDLSLFTLSMIANTSVNLNGQAQNILMKLIVWTTNQTQTKHLLHKIISKIHSTCMLIDILSYIKDFSQAPHFRRIITETHMQILKSLSAVQRQAQFFGMLPQTFFDQPIKYKPIWPIQEHLKDKIMKAGKRTNIFVLAKVCFFIYGMNPRVQREIFTQYLQRNPDQALDVLRDKL